MAWYAGNMTPRVLLLAAELLELAADEFPNHGCNDFRTPIDLTEADLASLADLHNLANFGTCDPAELKAKDPRGDDVVTPDRLRRYMHDWCLMQALAAGLRRQHARWLEAVDAAKDRRG